MKNIEILDCTLRDGGYINNWNFGKDNIEEIINNLIISNVDYIEIGYLNEDIPILYDSTCFNNFNQFSKFNNTKGNFLCMIDFGKYNLINIPHKSKSNIDGIRVAFHKKDIVEALDFCKELKYKGYKIFVQPMVTMSYSKEELENLIEKVNQLGAYAFYIVDSFGYMDSNMISEKTCFIDELLCEKILLGFHSHNNLQLSFSNTKEFINNVNKNRRIIVDSSVYGMGRGAGNLNTELIINYCNKNSNYNILPILEIMENILSNIKSEYNWGYSLEYFLSALYQLHPNYSKYLSDKKTLNILDIEKILNMVEKDKKIEFDEKYIESIYELYISNDIDDNGAISILKNMSSNKKVLLIGNGPSIKKQWNKIINNIKKDTLVISINNINPMFDNSILFLSNKKRFTTINFNNWYKVFYTSNIKINVNNALKFDYKRNLAKEFEVSDNSLLMLLNILIRSNVKEVLLAGFDGFDIDNEKNFLDQKLSYPMDKNRVMYVNSLIKKYLKEYEKKIKICWLTESKYKD